MPDNRFTLSLLRAKLRPFKLYWFTQLRSTNDHAIKLRAKHKLYAPAIVLTGHQLAGRGRGGNAWWSGSGSITVTFVLPVDDRLAPHQVPLLAGLAVRRACVEVSGSEDIRLKWPNDLLHDDLKLAGLLCERVNGVDLIGIGLNVNVRISDIPKKLQHRVTSLRGITGRTIQLNDALLALARHLQSLLVQRDQGSFDTLLKEYDRVHALVGRKVRISEPGANPPIEGICEGLDRSGCLLVRGLLGRHKIIAGHVELM